MVPAPRLNISLPCSHPCGSTTHTTYLPYTLHRSVNYHYSRCLSFFFFSFSLIHLPLAIVVVDWLLPDYPLFSRPLTNSLLVSPRCPSSLNTIIASPASSCLADMTGAIATPRYSAEDFETASIRSAAPSYGEDNFLFCFPFFFFFLHHAYSFHGSLISWLCCASRSLSISW